MLLHIFGDTHGPDEIFKINPKRFLNRDITKDDAIVVCGDFGFPFFPTDRIPADDLKTLDMPQHCIKSARAYSSTTSDARKGKRFLAMSTILLAASS